MSKPLLPAPKASLKVILRPIFYTFLAGVIIFLTTFSFYPEILLTFYSSPNISGWDGAAHEALMHVFQKGYFPSTWGWVTNWYGGMPFPIFYPPLIYIFGASIISIFHDSVLSYKIFATLIHLSVCMSAFVFTFQSMKKDFKTEFFTRHKKTIYLMCLLGVSTILAINRGSPGPSSLFASPAIAQNLSILFIFPALLSLISTSTSMIFIGGLSWTLIHISNTHTALSLGLFSFILLIVNTIHQSTAGRNFASNFWIPFRRFFVIHIIGVLGTSFWLLPMLSSHDYFTGAQIYGSDFSKIAVMIFWPHLLISLCSLYILKKSTDMKSRFVYSWSLSVFIVLIAIGIIQTAIQRFNLQVNLPIQFYRWVEMYFFLLIIPYTYSLIYFATHPFQFGKFKPGKSIEIRSSYIIVAIMILGFYSLSHSPHSAQTIYTQFEKDNIHQIAEKVAPGADLVSVRTSASIGIYDTKTMSLDAEIGKLGGNTTFSNLRESSVNAIFMRMMRNTLSRSSEDWGLTSFFKPTYSSISTPDQYFDLFTHMGVKKILAFNDPYPGTPEQIVFSSSTKYIIDKNDPKITTLTIPATGQFVTEINGLVGMYIGADGFKERKITDLNYTRFQEMIFENNFNKIFFNIRTGELDAEKFEKLYANTDFAVITDYHLVPFETLKKLIDKSVNTDLSNIHSARTSPQHTFTFFLYNDGSDEVKRLFDIYSRTSKVVFFKSNSPSYPFSPLVSKIRKLAKNSHIVETPLETTLRTDSNISAILRNTTPGSITESPKDKWVFVRQSYFPGWLAYVDGVPVDSFMASPGYTLVRIPKELLRESNSLTLVFTAPKSFYLGHYISLLAFAMLGIFAVVAYLHEKKKMHKTNK